MLKRKATIVIAFILLFLTLSLIFSLNIDSLETNLSKQVERYGIIGIFVLSFLLDFIPQIISPYIPLFAGLLLGINPMSVAFAAILGSTLASIAGFEIGKKHGEEYVRDLINRKDREKFEGKVKKYGKWGVLLAALTPVPYLPMVAGAIGITRKEIWGYGIIPRDISFILIGLFFNSI